MADIVTYHERRGDNIGGYDVVSYEDVIEDVKITEKNESYVEFIDNEGETVTLTWGNIVEVRESATEVVPPEDRNVIQRAIKEADNKEEAVKKIRGAANRRAIAPLTESQAEAIVDELS